MMHTPLCSRSYSLMGVMGERRWKHFSFFANFENILDVRQDRYQTMILPPVDRPSFREVWAPLEGFVADGGLKIISLNELFSRKETMEMTRNVPADKRWKIATGLALFTVVYNLGEGIISLYFGAQDEALALAGFGVDCYYARASWLENSHG